MREEHGNVNYSGIVSVDAVMDLTNKDAYSALVESESVYLSSQTISVSGYVNY